MAYAGLDAEDYDRLYSDWQYRLVIRGAFEGNTWRSDYGARNLNGMSLEYDYIIHFFTE